MKIVLNKCYGGFSISKEAAELMAANGCEIAKKELANTGNTWYGFDYSRTDKHLINAVETLGEKADGWAAKLKVIEIPDGTDYFIENYDGFETLREQHKSW